MLSSNGRYFSLIYYMNRMWIILNVLFVIGCNESSKERFMKLENDQHELHSFMLRPNESYRFDINISEDVRMGFYTDFMSEEHSGNSIGGMAVLLMRENDKCFVRSPYGAGTVFESIGEVSRFVVRNETEKKVSVIVYEGKLIGDGE